MLIDPDAGAEIVAPLFMTQFFGHFASDQAPVYIPSAPFFVAGVLGLLAILVFQRVTRHRRVDRLTLLSLQRSGKSGFKHAISSYHLAALRMRV